MTARRTPSAWWLLAAPAACVAILGLSEPVIFVWLLVGLVIGWALVASWKWFTWQERAVAAESDLMFAPVPAAPAAPVEVVGTKGTRLQLVPPQRDGSEWPAIMRAVEGEIGGGS